MRTPGNDFELAAGFVYSEGIVRARTEIAGLTYCIDPEVDPDQRYNIVNVELSRSTQCARPRALRDDTSRSVAPAASVDARNSIRCASSAPLRSTTTCSFRRASYTRCRSACARHSASSPRPEACTLLRFSTNAEARSSRAKTSAATTRVDKIVGWALLDGRLPLRRCALMVSGRASYEILQKARDGRRRDRRIRLGAEQPCRRARAGVQRHARGIRTRRPGKRLRGAAANRLSEAASLQEAAHAAR